MGHWEKLCFLHSSPKGKDGLCIGPFLEKLGQPLLAYVLDIWSSSGVQFPFLSFCRDFAQPVLLCSTSPASKAQGPASNYAEMNQKCPGAHDYCNTFKLPCHNTLHLPLTPATNLSQLPLSSTGTTWLLFPTTYSTMYLANPCKAP